ncbi:MAG: hypothetical protein KDD48_02865 [Bdellovibrionales bacterium]|nr:hypothetical protein [Bdellovibrionales bacterium]
MSWIKRFKTGYQRVIVRDVSSPSYSGQSKLAFRLYGIILVCLMGVYTLCFHSYLVTSGEVLWELHNMGLDSRVQPALRFIIFKYEYFIVFLVFMTLCMLFLAFGLFLFDMQQRNAVIKNEMNKKSE